MQHRARQRAGRRGQVLALRLRAREARAVPVVPQDHRLRPGASRRPRQAHRLAGERQGPAAQLDRPLRGRRDRLHARRQGRRDADGPQDHCLHDARRHAVRRELLPAPAREPACRRARCRHRVRGRVQGAQGGHREGLERRPPGIGAREARRVHGPLCHQPHQRQARPDLGRRLRPHGLRHRRRHGRALRRPARLRLRQEVRPGDCPDHLREGRSPLRRAQGRARAQGHERLLGPRHGRRGLPRAVRRVHRPQGRQALRGRGRHHRLAFRAWPRSQEGAVPPSRLAHQPSALLGQPHPDDPLRLLR